ncbi:MAG: serine hydrolase domain-containing protein [Acidobacteriota bacterium]
MNITHCLRLGVFSLIVGLCLTGCGAQPTTPASDDPLGRAIDALFEPWNRDDSPGAAVVVLQDGKPLYRKAFGLASLEDGTPITVDGTAFDIGSVSKQMTAYAAHLLASRGELDLDADIRTVLPDLPSFGRPLTTRQLMLHTSGLREYLDLATWYVAARDGASGPHGQATVIEWLGDQRELNFEPGTSTRYTNTGYVLLAEVVAAASGRSFHDFMRDEVFRPLGMHDTRVRGYGVDGERLATRSYGHAYRGVEAWWRGPYVRAEVEWATWGDGGVAATMGDLARWTEHLRLGERHPEVVAAMVERGRLNDGRSFDYGSGIRWMERWGVPIFGHGGSGTAFRSWALWVPDHAVTVVFSGNSFPGVLGLMPKLVETVFEHLDIGEPPVEVPVAEDLDAWVGHFADDTLRGRLFFEDDLLTYHSSSNHIPVVVRTDDTFHIRDTEIRGVRGPDGRIDALRFFAGADEVVMRRYEPVEDSVDERRAIAGSYRSPELGLTLRVEATDDGLDLVLPIGRFSFEVADGERFYIVQGRPTSFAPVYDESGRILGLRLNLTRSRGVWLDRLDADVG